MEKTDGHSFFDDHNRTDLLFDLWIDESIRRCPCSDQRAQVFYKLCCKSGDSLWDIADTYMTTGYSCVDEYIGEVIKSNRLESDVIYPGQLLILPYYSDRPLIPYEGRR